MKDFGTRIGIATESGRSLEDVTQGLQAVEELVQLTELEPGPPEAEAG